MPADSLPPRGLTPNEFGRIYRMSADRVRAMIVSGRLAAVNTADSACERPRYIIMPHHIAEWERRHAAAQPPKPPRRRKRIETVDYFPQYAD
jgi:hypothetical protein